MDTTEIVHELMLQEERFFDRVMKKELPEKYYRWAYSGIPFALKKVGQYLDQEKFVRRVHPDRVDITRRGVVIAIYKYPTFRSDFRNTTTEWRFSL